MCRPYCTWSIRTARPAVLDITGAAADPVTQTEVTRRLGVSHPNARRLAGAPAIEGSREICAPPRGRRVGPPRLNPRTVQRHSPCWSRREVALALPQRRRFGLWKRVRAAPGQSPRDGACQVPANGCNAAEGGLIDGEAQFSLLNAGDRSDRRFPARGAPRGGPGAPRERCRARA